MTSELTQIVNLIKSKNKKVENICYKEVHKIKISKEDGSNPIVFNTKSVLSKLVDYSNAYIEFQFDIKFATDATSTKGNLLLKNSYEIISELKIELNDRIVSNESHVDHNYIVNHLLEDGKNGDLIYRNIDVHTDVVKYDDTNKDNFLIKNGDTMRVVCNVFLKDISNFFKNLHMPLKLAEFNITLKLVDSIYVTDQDNTTQTLISSNLYVDQVVLHEIEEIQFVKNYNNFDVNISFLENYVKKDSQSTTNGQFDVGANNCSNANDMFLMLIKENGENNVNTLRLPNKRVKDLQLYIGHQKFQLSVNSDLEAFIELKKRSEYFDEFIIDYNRFLNNYTIYAFPINRYSKKDKSTKYINVTGVGVDEDASKAILVWRQMSNINLKINNNFLEVIKHIKYLYNIWKLVVNLRLKKYRNYLSLKILL